MKRKILILSLGLVFGSRMLWYASNTNPLLALKGMVLMEFKDAPVTSLFDNILISKGNDDFISYMKINGYELSDHHGRIYHYQPNEVTMIIISELFTSRYVVGKIN